jgi:hypothetical protein
MATTEERDALVQKIEYILNSDLATSCTMCSAQRDQPCVGLTFPTVHARRDQSSERRDIIVELILEREQWQSLRRTRQSS